MKSKRKSKKGKNKGGRPRKTLAELRVSGGYDRNPGRLRKRMGIDPEPESIPTPQNAETACKWDEFIELHEHIERRNAAVERALKLEAEGKDIEADKVLRRGGWDGEEIQQRREHVDWRRSQAVSASDSQNG